MKLLGILLSILSLFSCQKEDKKEAPFQGGSKNDQEMKTSFTDEECASVEFIDMCLSQRLSHFAVTKVDDNDFIKSPPEKVELGRQLFFDKVLSGNNDMACATCHHPVGHTADRFSLSAGSGSAGYREQRQVRTFEQLVPRHTPSLFNRGHKSFQKLFWDGRVQSVNGKLSTPAGDDLFAGLDNTLAAQAMFPPTSPVEMRGRPGENPVANLEHMPDIWNALFQKVIAIDFYRSQLQRVNPGVPVDKLSFVHVANAIGAFEAEAFKSTNSPFDAYLAGDPTAIAADEKKGALLFYGKAGCAQCHAGPFQTDHLFYNIGSPQFGPGKKDGVQENEDFGRYKITKKEDDKYRFKTAPLRNVALTPPYGKTGAFPTLEAIIRHKINAAPKTKVAISDELKMPGWSFRFETSEILNEDKQVDIVSKHNLPKVSLTDSEIYQLIAFLGALTDDRMRDMSGVAPRSVGSGLDLP